MGLVLLGALASALRLTAAIVIPVVLCQALTLFQIKSALQTIVH